MEAKAIALEDVSARNNVTSLYKHLHDHADDKDHSLSVADSTSGQLINTEARCVARRSDHSSQLLTAAPISLDPDIKGTAPS